MKGPGAATVLPAYMHGPFMSPICINFVDDASACNHSTVLCRGLDSADHPAKSLLRTIFFYMDFGTGAVGSLKPTVH